MELGNINIWKTKFRMIIKSVRFIIMNVFHNNKKNILKFVKM